MPNLTEPSYKQYILYDQYPVLVLNKSLGSMYSVDITNRFTNLFPKDCPLKNYKILKVVCKNEEVKNY